ncbi:hypothetical protein L0337_00745 [candidate division KSB1 bacterium]|nr:hypothetical protein [candidate division KSB1 bacterium]
MERLVSLLGMVAMIGIAYAMSYDRRQFPWRVVLWGTGLQMVFAFVILWTEPGKIAFQWAGDKISAFLGFTKYGTEFLFGNLVKPEYQNTFGLQFAFAILPTIIYSSAVMSILYHLGIMQKIVEGLAVVMAKTMGTSGAESLSCSANIFVGQTEAPLLIRPFIAKATNSELMAIRCGGFATIAGGVMAGYILMGVPWKDCIEFGNLLGTKISINEFVAYVNLSDLIKSGGMSARAQIIATYALCGFANFSSIAIQIGGIGGMAPERRGDLAKLGLRAMFGGALASWMTAAIAGMLIGG